MSIFDNVDPKTKEKLDAIAAKGKRRNTDENQHKSAGSLHRSVAAKDVKLPDFVAVDIETTGLNKSSDRITEIAAVKFENGKITDEFSTFVNPNIEIPKKITQLTGISADTVKDAPQFAEVMPKFIDFISRLAICGHNVDFDISFLNAEIKRNSGAEITNWNIDTLVLSRIILELEEGYALSKVAQHLNIKLENAHRALEDARASGFIAVKLIPRINDIPVSVRARVAQNSFGFTKRIFERTLSGYTMPQSPKYEISPSVKPIVSGNKHFLIDANNVDKIFRKRLSQVIQNYNVRDEQIEFAQIAAKAINDKKICAVEAGTGTGKTVGYLIPAIIASLHKNERILVSTNTKQLQNQLVKNDLPLLAKLFEKKLSFALLKGKNNYVCRNAFEEVLSGTIAGISPKERSSLLPLIVWYDKTKSGDIDEQNAFNRRTNKQLWDKISSENKQCAGCKYVQSCFLNKAKKFAMSCHIVVVNHAFFYSDIIAGNDITENTAAIIFDEAHHLEETGYYSLQTEVDTNRMGISVESFQNVHTALHNLTKESHEQNAAFIDDVIKLKHIIHNMRKDVDTFTKETADWIIANAPKDQTSQNSIVALGYRDAPFEKFVWLKGVLFNLKEFYDSLRGIEQKHNETIKGKSVCAAITSAQKTAQQLKADIEYVCGAKTDTDIFWAECPSNRKWAKLTGTTTNICDFLNPFWKRYAKPVIFTSATLSPQKNIEYFAKRVGIADLNPVLKEFETKDGGKDKIFFAASLNSPETGTHEHNIYTAQTIAALRERYKKNILALFTNNEFLEEVFAELTKDDKHCNVFAQGISGNNAWIQQQMKESEDSVLLGSGSFWEGIDMPGKQCEIVIIPKLPFPVPTHPLQKQLAQNAEKDGQSGFIAYSLPETLLKFRQGIGRLIRREEDKGALFVLDSRIITKNYGKNFVDIAGGDLNKFDGLADIFDKLDTFFDNAGV